MAKSDHRAKILYVYLLTYIILYKKYCLLGVGGGGQNDVFVPTIYYWGGGNRPSAPRIDAPEYCHLYLTGNTTSSSLFFRRETSWDTMFI